MKKILFKKLVTIGLIISMMAFGMAGCGSDSAKSDSSTSTQSDASSGDLKVLRIGAGGQAGSEVLEGAALAVENGYLKEELNAIGYSLEIVPLTTGGPEINEALAAGELEGAIVGDFPTFTAKSNGIDTTIVALTNHKNQYGILVASDDIKTPKDLEGKKVILPQGTITQYFWENYAEANDIDVSKVELINASSDAASLLQTGDADAYVVTKYIVAYYESIGLGTSLEGGADISDIGTTFVFEVKSELLEENAELGTAINKALIRSYEAAIEDPEALYAALASDTIPAEAWKVAYAFDDTLSFLSPEITSETLEYYNNLSEWMLNNSIITEKVDVSSFVDDSYYAKAKEALGE